MSDITITPTDNGPYLDQGSVILLDAEGNQYEVGDTIALCRCGLSEHEALLRRRPREGELLGNQPGSTIFSSNQASSTALLVR